MKARATNTMVVVSAFKRETRDSDSSHLVQLKYSCASQFYWYWDLCGGQDSLLVCRASLPRESSLLDEWSL